MSYCSWKTAEEINIAWELKFLYTIDIVDKIYNQIEAANNRNPQIQPATNTYKTKDRDICGQLSLQIATKILRKQQ